MHEAIGYGRDEFHLVPILYLIESDVVIVPPIEEDAFIHELTGL